MRNLTAGETRLALDVVKHASGGAYPESADVYARVRDELVARDGRRRQRGARLAERLPAASQLLPWYGSWGATLSAAGLEGVQQRRRAPALAMETAIEAFIDLSGVAPSFKTLAAWARLHGFALDRRQELEYTNVRRVVVERLRQGGRLVASRRWSGPLPPPPANAPVRRNPVASYEEVVASLALFLVEHPGLSKVTQTTYRQTATGDPRFRSASTIARVAERNGRSVAEMWDDAARLLRPGPSA